MPDAFCGNLTGRISSVGCSQVSSGFGGQQWEAIDNGGVACKVEPGRNRFEPSGFWDPL